MKYYQKKIKVHRQALKKWQNDINDLGDTPEKSLLSIMWPRGVQPKTLKPEVFVSNNVVTVKSSTLGSSIGYILSDEDFDPSLDDGWKLYHEPVIVNKRYIYVLSTRLGFEDSDIIKIKL